MLADQGEFGASIGGLRKEVQLTASWQSLFLAFLADELPKWRDSSDRTPATAENQLTSQLCAHMNDATRLARGWDFLQFRTEEPDETVGGRAIDLIAAPSGTLVWLEGREYSKYTPLIPIECKRLPTPKGQKRDEREYLYCQHSSTGGVHRFKEGLHGAAHLSAAMIAYVQESDIQHWVSQINNWLIGLVGEGISGWSMDDAIALERHESKERLATLRSTHSRSGELQDIRLDHLWIEMKKADGM